MHLPRRIVHLEPQGGAPSQETSTQPIPRVTADDVERIVYRDFPVEEFASVMVVLSGYGAEKWEGDRTRVRLAALKVANGSLPKLRACIESAKRDYRDALTRGSPRSRWPVLPAAAVPMRPAPAPRS
jgi:hypothetical protein